MLLKATPVRQPSKYRSHPEVCGNTCIHSHFPFTVNYSKMLGIHTSKYHASHHIFLLMKDIWWQSEKLIHKSASRKIFHTVTQAANLFLVCASNFSHQLTSLSSKDLDRPRCIKQATESLETSVRFIFEMFIS